MREQREPKNQVLTLDISWQALIKLVAMAIIIWAAFVLRNIIFMLFIVFIFVAAVNPTINALQRYMSRGIAVALFFTLMFFSVALIMYLFVPRVIVQLNELVRAFPGFVDQLRPIIDSFQSDRYSSIVDDALRSLSSNVQRVSGNVFQTILNVFGGLTTLVTGLVLSFYLLLEERNAREFFHQVLPQNRYHAAYVTVRKISHQLGAWVRGQLTVMLAVGLLNFLSYYIIGVPSPLPLSIWSGLCEAIPYIGPVIGVLPGFLVAIAGGNPLQVVLVIAINYFVIQQLQNFYITPRVMGKAIGLSPVLVILAIMVGISLFGVLGAVIALPTAAVVSVVVTEWPHLRQIWEQAEHEEVEVQS